MRVSLPFVFAAMIGTAHAEQPFVLEGNSVEVGSAYLTATLRVTNKSGANANVAMKGETASIGPCFGHEQVAGLDVFEPSDLDQIRREPNRLQTVTLLYPDASANFTVTLYCNQDPSQFPKQATVSLSLLVFKDGQLMAIPVSATVETRAAQ